MTVHPETGEVLDLAPAQARHVQTITDIDPLAIIEQRNRLLDRILEVAIASTHAGQWTNLGGKPWPTGAAAEAMARRCAVSVTNISREKLQSHDDKGPFYIWVYRATFSLPGGRDVLEAEGTCSSRDSFLGTETSNGRPMSEVDEGSIMKAAFTNCRVNGITQLLGLRNMTWERLESLGIKTGDVAKVEYKSGSRGGGGQGQGGDVELRFGSGKGKKLSDLPDDDVHWYIGTWKRDLADPSKSKFHANSKRSIEAAEALLKARAEKAGAAAPAPYEQILAAAKAAGKSDDEAATWVRGRGRKARAEVTAEDVKAFAEWVAAQGREPGGEG